jgi:hypothetical protein
MQYELRICKGTSPDAIQVLKSSQPFMPVQRGDILHTGNWSSTTWNSVYEVTDECPHGVQLRVIGFEHQIIQMEDETTQLPAI